jgi:hypothetical protein
MSDIDTPTISPHLRLVRIYRAASTTEAHLLVQQLNRAGVAARLLGEVLDASYGQVSGSGNTGAEIWVTEDQADEAQQLLTQSIPSGQNLVTVTPAQFNLTQLFLAMSAIAIGALIASWTSVATVFDFVVPFGLTLPMTILFLVAARKMWKNSPAETTEPR